MEEEEDEKPKEARGGEEPGRKDTRARKERRGRKDASPVQKSAGQRGKT